MYYKASSIEVDETFGCEQETVDFFHSMSEHLNSHPASLTKLAVLAIRQCVLRHGKASNFDKLGLPQLLVNLINWKKLSEELKEMWV